VLFILVKAYFSNTYIYGMRDDVEKRKSDANIENLVDLFNNRKAVYEQPRALSNSSNSPDSNGNGTSGARSLLEKAILSNKRQSVKLLKQQTNPVQNN
jgi:hypothetical protein